MNTDNVDRSRELYGRACQHIPGGVNSPVRAFQAVDQHPIFVSRGQGAYVIDAQNKHYIDYIGSWGPLILGHAHPRVISAVTSAIQHGLSYGVPTEIEVEMAELIVDLMPSLEMVRMVNSGTEATMSAIRLARAFTGRDKIIKFAGCYHGHSDSLLVNAGSGGLTFGVPSSPGVPKSIAQHTLTANFNDLNSVDKLLNEHGDSIAAIIVEPVAANMGCILPQAGFLEGLRQRCDQNKSLLIFDEVITGFRLHSGGAQALYSIKPDLTTLGKIIGGGMPVGAFGGQRQIMEQLSPIGPVYQAGTLSGNPIAMAAGYATLSELMELSPYDSLTNTTQRLVSGLKARASDAGIDIVINQVGSIFSLFFTSQPAVESYDEVKKCNVDRFKQFFKLMLRQGIYLAPSAFESAFISTVHFSEEINLTLDAAESAFAELK